MPSLEEFRELLHSGSTQQAFTDYMLDFNTQDFDVNVPVQGVGYEAEIVWRFESPNIIKMHRKTISDSGGKRIYYLPWARGRVTTVTLDGNSPPYFVTSHFSNCRFTIHYHDGEGRNVTVMHVAGDVSGGGTVRGSQQRDELESSVQVDNVQRTRRLSISNQKTGKGGKAHMEKGMSVGTTYYDSYARVFGIRRSSGSWVFYAQNIKGENELLGLTSIG